MCLSYRGLSCREMPLLFVQLLQDNHCLTEKINVMTLNFNAHVVKHIFVVNLHQLPSERVFCTHSCAFYYFMHRLSMAT